jgi:hypothetical protein
MDTRAGVARAHPAIAKRILIGVSASLRPDVGQDDGRIRRGGVGSSSNWPGRVFTQVMIATAKEFPPSSGPVLALPCDSDLRAAPQPATPRTRTTTFTMGGGGKIPYEKHAN